MHEKMKRYNKLITLNVLLLVLVVFPITSLVGNPMPSELQLDCYSYTLEIKPMEMILCEPTDFVNLTLLTEIHNDQNPTLNIRIRWSGLDYYNLSTFNNKTEISFRKEKTILCEHLDIFLIKWNDSYYSYSFVYDVQDERGYGEIYHEFGFIPFTNLNTSFLIENKGSVIPSQLQITYFIYVYDYNGNGMRNNNMPYHWWLDTWMGLFTILSLSISSFILVYQIIKKIIGRVKK